MSLYLTDSPRKKVLSNFEETLTFTNLRYLSSRLTCTEIAKLYTIPSGIESAIIYNIFYMTQVYWRVIYLRLLICIANITFAESNPTPISFYAGDSPNFTNIISICTISTLTALNVGCLRSTCCFSVFLETHKIMKSKANNYAD